MQTGDANPNFKCKMRDLGVIISNYVKVIDQCTVNKMLSLISKYVNHKLKWRLHSICEATPRIRDPIRSSNYIKDQNVRATKHIPILRTLSYKERLKQLSMFPLHKQRIRRDMIEVLKNLSNFYKINPWILFEMNNVTITRGNSIIFSYTYCIGYSM